MANDRDHRRLILDSLEIPAPGPTPTVLLVLSGLPGSGKSTLATRLAARHPFCVVATDRVRKALFETRTYSRRESTATHRVAHDVLDCLLRRGIWCMLDGTNLRRRHRETALARGTAAGARTAHIQMAVSAALARDRLGTGGAERRGSEAGMEVYELLRTEFEPEPDGAENIIPPGMSLAAAVLPAEKIAGLAGNRG